MYFVLSLLLIDYFCLTILVGGTTTGYQAPVIFFPKCGGWVNSCLFWLISCSHKRSHIQPWIKRLNVPVAGWTHGLSRFFLIHDFAVNPLKRTSRMEMPAATMLCLGAAKPYWDSHMDMARPSWIPRKWWNNMDYSKCYMYRFATKPCLLGIDNSSIIYDNIIYNITVHNPSLDCCIIFTIMNSPLVSNYQATTIDHSY